MKTTKAILKNVKKLQMKPLDFVLIFVLMVISFAPFLLLSPKQSVQPTAQLRVDGKVIKNFDLTRNQTYTYRDKDGDINEIEVRDRKIGITYANCPDQVCVRKGFIDKAGQTIVCLPHKLVIEVISADERQEVIDYI